MFLHDFIHLDLPAAAVRRLVLEDAGRWLGAHATEAAAEGERLRVRIGPSVDCPLLGKKVEVTVDHSYVRDDVTVIHMTWTPTGPAIFPVLDADLEIAALGDDCTELTLLGRYEPPLGGVGRHLDSLLLHRLAEASVRAFLRRMGNTLQAQASSTVRPGTLGLRGLDA